MDPLKCEGLLRVLYLHYLLSILNSHTSAACLPWRTAWWAGWCGRGRQGTPAAWGGCPCPPAPAPGWPAPSAPSSWCRRSLHPPSLVKCCVVLPEIIRNVTTLILSWVSVSAAVTVHNPLITTTSQHSWVLRHQDRINTNTDGRESYSLWPPSSILPFIHSASAAGISPHQVDSNLISAKFQHTTDNWEWIKLDCS